MRRTEKMSKTCSIGGLVTNRKYFVFITIIPDKQTEGFKIHNFATFSSISYFSFLVLLNENETRSGDIETHKWYNRMESTEKNQLHANSDKLRGHFNEVSFLSSK